MEKAARRERERDKAKTMSKKGTQEVFPSASTGPLLFWRSSCGGVVLFKRLAASPIPSPSLSLHPAK